MKNLKIFIMLFLSLSFATSCIDDDNDELTGNAIEGGLLNVNNPAIGYVVGNDGTYTATGSVYQGNVQTVSIEIYNSFTSSVTKETSNEVLLDAFTINGTEIGSTSPFSFSFTYEDLISGLTLDGSPLPSNDGGLSIGDFWSLRYVATTSEGNAVSNPNITKVSVGTRFAGNYKVLVGNYFRIGVPRPDVAWPATMVIESVDATTYRVAEYFGPFNGNEYYFQIDENDKITYPDETPDGDAQSANGQPLITCESDPIAMSTVPCGPATNIVVKDDVTGKDRLIMSVGYFTAGSGPRTIYQVLEKIVE